MKKQKALQKVREEYMVLGFGFDKWIIRIGCCDETG